MPSQRSHQSHGPEQIVVDGACRVLAGGAWPFDGASQSLACFCYLDQLLALVVDGTQSSHGSVKIDAEVELKVLPKKCSIVDRRSLKGAR